jgi:hypothetical protein
MPRRQKNILIVIFLTPLTAIVFAILRFAFQTTESIGPTINPARLVVYSTLELSFCMYRNSPSYKKRFVLSSCGADWCLIQQSLRHVFPHSVYSLRMDQPQLLLLEFQSHNAMHNGQKGNATMAQ